MVTGARDWLGVSGYLPHITIAGYIIYVVPLKLRDQVVYEKRLEIRKQKQKSKFLSRSKGKGPPAESHILDPTKYPI